MVPQSQLPELVRFAEFELDCHTGNLCRNGAALRLQPQPAKVLAILVRRAGQVVTRHELAEQVWGSETFVDFEQGLNYAIRQIRTVLGDDAEQPRFLETLPKRGYRFIAHVSGPADIIGVPLERLPLVTAPTRRAANKLRILVFASATIVAALILTFAGQRFRPHLSASAHAHQIQSIAVLPLRNLSPDPEQDYFSDGMTDELITALTKSHGIRVISHTSVERYKATKRSLPDIARELGVDAIVEGTVTRSGDRIRITAQLIDARSDLHVWAESYQADYRDVLDLQNEVAKQVAREIGVSLSRPVQSNPDGKVDPFAYDAYLKGIFFFDQMRCSTFAKALSSFEEAIARDPKFAPAYSGMADSYFELADWRCEHAGSFDEAESSALKAIALDSDLARAHAVVAKIAFYRDWNPRKAEEEFSKAIHLDPSDAGIHANYGMYLVAIGKANLGLTELDIAQQIDPVSEKTNLTHTWALFLAHHFDEAIAQAKQALELSPSNGQYYWLGECYEKKGMPDEAMSFYLKLWDASPEERTLRRAAYQKDGLPGYWRRDEQSRMRSNLKIDAFFQAMYYAHLGERGKALKELQLGYRQHCDGLQFLKVDPHFDSLRGEPGFKELLTQIGL